MEFIIVALIFILGGLLFVILSGHIDYLPFCAPLKKKEVSIYKSCYVSYDDYKSIDFGGKGEHTNIEGKYIPYEIFSKDSFIKSLIERKETIFPDYYEALLKWVEGFKSFDKAWCNDIYFINCHNKVVIRFWAETSDSGNSVMYDIDKFRGKSTNEEELEAFKKLHPLYISKK